LKEAEATYTEAVGHLERLVRDRPAMPSFQDELAMSYGNLALIYLKTERPAEALALVAKAIPLLETLSRSESHGKNARRVSPVLRADAARVRTMLERQKAKAARGLAAQGKHAAAAADVDGLAAADGQGRYDAACVLALAAQAARTDPDLSDAARARIADQYAARALDLLRRAREAGHFQTESRRTLLRDDPDLEALRGRAEFQAFLAQVGPD
jgi:hypothetical protein